VDLNVRQIMFFWEWTLVKICVSFQQMFTQKFLFGCFIVKLYAINYLNKEFSLEEKEVC